MKDYPDRALDGICECRHEKYKHVEFFTAGRCQECMCPKYNEEIHRGDALSS